MNELYDVAIDYAIEKMQSSKNDYRRENLDLEALENIITFLLQLHPELFGDTELLSAVAFCARLDPHDRVNAHD